MTGWHHLRRNELTHLTIKDFKPRSKTSDADIFLSEHSFPKIGYVLKQFPRAATALLVFTFANACAVQLTHAERISNPVAEFSGLDKITGRITTFDVYINETVQFGALQVTPKVCYSRTEDEAPRTDAFVEVEEITLDRKIRRIFTGWMFADSPGLNAVEHPIYDIWLKNCKQSSTVPAPE